MNHEPILADLSQQALQPSRTTAPATTLGGASVPASRCQSGRTLALAALLFTGFVCSIPANAATRTWTLVGVQFADGGLASGTIDADADSGVPQSWNLSVTGGNTSSFPPATFTAGNSQFFPQVGGSGSRMVFVLAGPDLRSGPQITLAKPCGPVGIELIGPAFNHQCF